MSGHSDSHKLLLDCARIHTGFPHNELSVIRERGKKPYFAHHPEIHFSVSHSGNCWICAYAESDIGVDIQICGNMTRAAKLADRFFHHDEALAVKNAENPDAVFFKIWSRKEAVVKMLGIGIDASFSSFSVLGETSELMSRRIQISDISLPFPESHCAAIACQELCGSKIIFF